LAKEIKKRMVKKLSKLMPFFKRCKFWRDIRSRSVLPKDVENSHEHTTLTSGTSPEKPASGKKTPEVLSEDEIDQLLSEIKIEDKKPAA
jgi:hypothetical protein